MKIYYKIGIDGNDIFIVKGKRRYPIDTYRKANKTFSLCYKIFPYIAVACFIFSFASFVVGLSIGNFYWLLGLLSAIPGVGLLLARPSLVCVGAIGNEKNKDYLTKLESVINYLNKEIYPCMFVMKKIGQTNSFIIRIFDNGKYLYFIDEKRYICDFQIKEWDSYIQFSLSEREFTSSHWPQIGQLFIGKTWYHVNEDGTKDTSFLRNPSLNLIYEMVLNFTIAEIHTSGRIRNPDFFNEELFRQRIQIVGEQTRDEFIVKPEYQRVDIVENQPAMEEIETQALAVEEGPSFEKRGYNILNNKFFLYLAYSEYYKEKREFDTFEEFYNFLNGDIYNQACYFGYSFDENQIIKYKLDLSKVNFDAFISCTIDDYTFDKVIENENQRKNEYESLFTTREQVEDWVKQFSFANYYLFSQQVENFCEKFKGLNSRSSSALLYFLIKEFNVEPLIREYSIRYVKENYTNYYKNITFFEILAYFGQSAADEIIEYIKNLRVDPSTKSRRKKKYTNFEDVFINERQSLYDEKSYDKYLDLFVLGIKENPNEYYSRTYLYFQTIDEMADYLRCDVQELNYLVEEKANNNGSNLMGDKKWSEYKIFKYFDGKLFHVDQAWFDNNKLTNNNTFESPFVCDFVHYLKNDITNSDLLLCDGIEHLLQFQKFDLTDVKIVSSVLDLLNIPYQTDITSFVPITFEESEKHEKSLPELYEKYSLFDYNLGQRIFYISDIHLEHKIVDNKCKTYDDTVALVRKIVTNFNDCELRRNDILLIAGDTAASTSTFQLFINELHKHIDAKIFILLGNHELLFEGNFSILETRKTLEKDGIHLVNNNLFYFEDNDLKEISTEELMEINADVLRERLLKARLIIFGGPGFDGYEARFEKLQENRDDDNTTINKIYKKISSPLSDKNVVIFTHLPITHWAFKKNINKNFMYVSGHTHDNILIDDGKRRIYCDNQIGYHRKIEDIRLRAFYVDDKVNIFSNYPDGIHSISLTDYDLFYKYLKEPMEIGTRYTNDIYMIKKNGAYMFLNKNKNGEYLILNGGKSVKNTNNRNLQFYYNNIDRYSERISSFMNEFFDYQEKISKEIKLFGGRGRIHGNIIDIDDLNHVYVNCIDGTVTPYYADSIIYKYVYKNIASLLFFQRKDLYTNYHRLLENEKKESYELIKETDAISMDTTPITETEIYKTSRILKNLQFYRKNKVIRIWNDDLITNKSIGNGKSIVLKMLGYNVDKK